ncbi:MAG TPA: Ig-like domain-containing protein [Streptosporangiaceae bacterium]|nr:Ig-like domain-containing protein [Streptosporangiaceae bacterium]
MRWRPIRAVTAGVVGTTLTAAALVASGAGISQARLVAAAASPPGPTGHWGKAKPVSLAGLHATGGTIERMSCSSRGNCTAAGTYSTKDSPELAFVVSEVHGEWGKATPIPGLAKLAQGPSEFVSTVSCASPGNCAVGGEYLDANAESQPFVVDSVNGTWHRAISFSQGDTGLDGFVAGNCAIGGSYSDAKGKELPFVADESTVTVTTVSLSAAKATVGHEQSVRVTVKVTPRGGGTPTGKVTILANTTRLCRTALTGRTASCTLRARQLRPGRYKIGAAYDGDPTYASSKSGHRPVLVVMPPS